MARKKRWEDPVGVIAFPRSVVRSPAYQDLSLSARGLMIQLQDVWHPQLKQVHFSTRRAGEKLNCSQRTATRAFNELIDHGFITVVEESHWKNGKAREYHLNWLKNNGEHRPTDEWKNWSPKTDPTSHQESGRPPKRVTREAVGKSRQSVQPQINDLAAEKSPPTPKSGFQVTHHNIATYSTHPAHPPEPVLRIVGGTT